MAKTHTKLSIVDALHAALKRQNGEGSSVMELSEQTGMSVDVIRARLGALHREGRLIVGRKSLPAIDGTVRPIPVYRIKSA